MKGVAPDRLTVLQKNGSARVSLWIAQIGRGGLPKLKGAYEVGNMREGANLSRVRRMNGDE